MGGKCIYPHLTLLQMVFDLQNGKLCDFFRCPHNLQQQKSVDEATKVFSCCLPRQKIVTQTLISTWPLHFSTIMLMLIMVCRLYGLLLREKKNGTVCPLQALHGNALILHFFPPFFSFFLGKLSKTDLVQIKIGKDENRG